MKIMIAIIIAVFVVTPCFADYSSLTPEERQGIATALYQAWEYKALLDGAEVRKIEEAVNVEGTRWRIRLLLQVPKQQGGFREIRRDLYIDVKAQAPGTSWIVPAISFAGGVLLGVLVAK